MKKWTLLPLSLVLCLSCTSRAFALTPPMKWAPPTPAVLPLLLEGDCSIQSGQLNYDAVYSNRLSYELVLTNKTGRPQQNKVAIPFLASAGALDRDLRQGVLLDGKAVEGDYRFAPYPASPTDREQEADPMAAWTQASIAASLEGLQSEGPYRLQSFDETTPLSGYRIPIKSQAEVPLSISLGYDPARTRLLVDTDGSAFVGERTRGKDGHPGYIDMNLKAGEDRSIGVYILGEDTFTFQVTQGPSDLKAEPVSGVLLDDLMERYLNVYDYERSAPVIRAQRELALRCIDSQFFYGNSHLLDVGSLAYRTTTTDFLSAYVISVPLEPGERRTLSVQPVMFTGLDARDQEGPDERMAVVYTEPLKSWTAVDPILCQLQAPSQMKDLRSVPTLERQQGRTYAGTLDLSADQNIYFGLLGSFGEGGSWGTLLMFLPGLFLATLAWTWPFILLLLAGVGYGVYRLVRRRKKSGP